MDGRTGCGGIGKLVREKAKGTVTTFSIPMRCVSLSDSSVRVVD